MKSVRFYDENTRPRWVPITGGANVPALNELLAPFGVAFSDTVYRGELRIGVHPVPLASAAGPSPSAGRRWCTSLASSGHLDDSQTQRKSASLVREGSRDTDSRWGLRWWASPHEC